MSWKDYVPKEKRSVFKQSFIELLTDVELPSLMNSAAFYGTHHHYDEGHLNDKEEACDNCLDDSDDRNTKEFAYSFFKGLWEKACANAVVEPQHKKKKRTEEEEEEEE